jgi:3-mercaptopyruvate sulfurtransferase SseA
MRDFFSKDWIALFSQRHVKKVLVGDSKSQERSAYLLLQELGFENLAILQGGFDAFKKTILIPSTSVPTGTRGEIDVLQFREKARADILKMIETNKNKGPKEPKKGKKIQGGC